jgi:hypothetical protein
VQASIARQTAAIEAARSYLHSCVAELWDGVSSGAPPTIDAISAVWSAAHHAVEAALGTVDVIYAAGGVDVFLAGSKQATHRAITATVRRACDDGPALCRRYDVAVQTEQVYRIVQGLDLGQACVCRPVIAGS